jgi:hypothetical protein
MVDFKEVLLFLSIGVLAVIARLLLALEKITFFTFFRAAITGALVGLALGLTLLEQTDLAPIYKYIIFGIAVSLAEDFIAGILNVGKQWRTNPQSILELFRRK